MLIEAIHEEGAVAIQVGCGIAAHRVQRTADRARQVLLRERCFRKHVDDLGATVHELPGAVDIDPLHQACVPLRLPTETTRC
jgi:hypothetical protein